MAFEELEHPITATTTRFGGKRAKYVPNHRSFGAFMRSEQMRDVTEEVANAIARRAARTQPGPSESNPERTGATYRVKRNAGVVKVSGNIRVRVLVEGTGDGVERAEFGGPESRRYRTLGAAGAHFGDFKHSEALK